jgi:carboxypeptidase D
MLYVDQPIGTGFSYGDDPVKSTVTAAPYVWKFLQAFLAQFPQYKSRDFGVFSESYGGHFGPEFSNYIQEKNDQIGNGTAEGENLNLIALGINNGLYDMKIQEKANIEFARNNTYKQLLSESRAQSLLDAFDRTCGPALDKCGGETGDTVACLAAYEICQFRIDLPIQIGADFDVYDIRQPEYSDPYPPEQYSRWLSRADVRKAIGANTTYSECSSSAESPFVIGGDGKSDLTNDLDGTALNYVR